MIPSRFVDNIVTAWSRRWRRRSSASVLSPTAAAWPAALALAFVLHTAPRRLDAQQELPVGGVGPFVRFELAKPLFDTGPFHDSHFATTAGDVSLVVPLRGTLSAFARVGFAVGEIEERGWSGAISNTRIGASLGRRGSIHGRLHVDLPSAFEISDGYATGVGRYTFFEEFERYAEDSWAIGGSVTAEGEPGPGAYVGARLGGSLVLPNADGIDKDAYVHFAVFGDAPAGEARLWFEVSGVALLSDANLNASEATAFFGTFSISLPNATLAPEAYARLPIDENLGGIVRFVLGLRIHIGNTRRR